MTDAFIGLDNAKPTPPPPLAEVRCPLCCRRVFHSMKVAHASDEIEGRWLHCYCGLLFNLYRPDYAAVFTEAYRTRAAERKEIAPRYDWYLRCYATLIEELTYGRRFLDVGYCTTHVIDAMSERGWIATGIDLIAPTPPLTAFQGDFETRDFGDATFNCIWLGDVLQCFRDPAAALRKCFALLRPTGLLFIVTPDSDLLRLGRFADFGHWDLEENRQFLNRELLRNLLALASPDPRQGRFNILYHAQNFSQRFPSWNNQHLLAQKEDFSA